MRTSIHYFGLALSLFMFSACGGDGEGSTSSAFPSLTNIGGNYTYTFAECDDSNQKIKEDPDNSTKLEISRDEFRMILSVVAGCEVVETHRVVEASESKVSVEFVSMKASEGCTQDIKDGAASYEGDDMTFTYSFEDDVLRLTETSGNFCDAWIKQ